MRAVAVCEAERRRDVAERVRDAERLPARDRVVAVDEHDREQVRGAIPARLQNDPAPISASPSPRSATTSRSGRFSATPIAVARAVPIEPPM